MAQIIKGTIKSTKKYEQTDCDLCKDFGVIVTEGKIQTCPKCHGKLLDKTQSSPKEENK